MIIDSECLPQLGFGKEHNKIAFKQALSLRESQKEQCTKGDMSSHGFVAHSHIVLWLCFRLHYYKKLCGPYWCVISQSCES